MTVRRVQAAKFVSGDSDNGLLVLTRSDASTVVCGVAFAFIKDVTVTVNNDSTVDLTFTQ